ncbi:DUF4328 domain-containing protein [Streptomyces sp. NPDC058751]|uniref:DUF4328 domain-containing protein n=1 Tax=Streptomyces sp. NPDC058751 TaxID=3346623 RepID=UPI0036999511
MTAPSSPQPVPEGSVPSQPAPEGPVPPQPRERAEAPELSTAPVLSPAPRRSLPPLSPLLSPHGPASLRSPVVLGGITVALLGLVVAADLFAVWADYKTYDVAGAVRGALTDGFAGSAGSFESLARRADEADLLSMRAGQAQAITLLAAGVAFLIWFRRVRINAEVFLPFGHAWSRSWMFWGWIVPFVNLWRPRQVMADIWDASRPAGTRSRLGLVNAWWAFWIAGLLAGRIFAVLYRKAETPREVRDAAFQGMIADGLDIVAAVFAVVVVLKLTRMQTRKAQEGPVASDD